MFVEGTVGKSDQVFISLSSRKRILSLKASSPAYRFYFWAHNNFL